MCIVRWGWFSHGYASRPPSWTRGGGLVGGDGFPASGGRWTTFLEHFFRPQFSGMICQVRSWQMICRYLHEFSIVFRVDSSTLPHEVPPQHLFGGPWWSMVVPCSTGDPTSESTKGKARPCDRRSVGRCRDLQGMFCRRHIFGLIQ